MLRSSLALSVVAIALCCAPHAHAQPRIAIADPYHAHLVSGRVLLDSGAPAAGVIVERMASPTGDHPFSPGAYRETTDARGAFEFHFAGLGVSTGMTWYLAITRAGCAPSMHTITLERGPVPPENREGDVRTGLELRLPACASRAPEPASPTSAPCEIWEHARRVGGGTTHRLVRGGDRGVPAIVTRAQLEARTAISHARRRSPAQTSRRRGSGAPPRVRAHV